MSIKYLLLLSRQGKVRLSKWYIAMSQQEKQRVTKELTAIVPLRKSKMCNVLEYKDSKLVYRRYASLFFIACIGNDDNELLALEVIQRYVEVMDKIYGNVCELDIIFNFQLAYQILDELVIDGVMQESSSSEIIRRIAYQEQMQHDDAVQSVYT
ncbi:APS1 [Brettanomyces bruxellensis]|uniref:AP complex subunit sigma n=1 Tax=Dekkera bruxellensis TaxID=5007 RepID=A0A7D9GYB4_DEKBR|nr:APS1 [Brettanomyces bruxellensis]